MKLRNILFLLIMMVFILKMDIVYADVSNIQPTLKIAATEDSDVDSSSDLENEDEEESNDSRLLDSGNEGDGSEDNENGTNRTTGNGTTTRDATGNRTTTRERTGSTNNSNQNRNIVNIKDGENADQDIPQTGINQFVIIFLILVFLINSVIIFKKLKKYNV